MGKTKQATERTQESKISKFLWWVATAHYPVLKNCPTEYIRMSIVGTVVLVTASVGFFSGLYFFNDLTQNIPLSIVLGLFFAYIIFTIDRLLIASLNKKIIIDEEGQETAKIEQDDELEINLKIDPTSPTFIDRENTGIKARFVVMRLLISVVIGLLYSEPLVLSFFETEINDQIRINNAHYLKERLNSQAAVDSIELQQINSQIKRIEDKRSKAKADMDTSYNQFKVEMDGAYGSSGKRGYDKIAKQKENRYIELKNKYNSTVTEDQALYDTLNKRIDKIRVQSADLLLSETNRVLSKVFLKVKKVSNFVSLWQNTIQ